MKQFFVVIAVLLTLVACSAEQKQSVPEITDSVQAKAETSIHDVQIKNFEFVPKVLTIKSGDSVTWTNLDDVTHTVTSADFDTGALGKGESKTLTFDSPGTYAYMCAVHPDMQGAVIVE